MAIGLQRKSAPARLGEVAWLAFGLGVAQVAVGAIMVLSHLPPVWRALHAALGTALWVGLVWLTWIAFGRLSEPTQREPAASG